MNRIFLIIALTLLGLSNPSFGSIVCHLCGANNSFTVCNYIPGPCPSQIPTGAWCNPNPTLAEISTAESAIIVSSGKLQIAFSVDEGAVYFLGVLDTTITDPDVIPSITPIPNPSYDNVKFDLTGLQKLAAYASINLYDSNGNRVAILDQIHDNQLYWVRGLNASGDYYFDVIIDNEVVSSGQIRLL